MLSKKMNLKRFCRDFNGLKRIIAGRYQSTSACNIVRPRVADLKLSQCLLHEYVWSRLDKWYDKTALVCAETGRILTYGDVYKKSQSLGTFLRKYKKLKPSDTVAIYLPNMPEYAVIVLGATQYSLKITTINPVYTVEEIKRQVLDSDTKVIFTLRDSYPTVHEAVRLCQRDISIVVIKDKQDVPMPDKALKFEEITDIPSENNKDYVDIHDVVCLPYSSGTTGLPKGVQLTHHNIVSNLEQMATPEFKLNVDTGDNHQDIIPLILPMYHIYGLSVILLNMFSHGCKLVTVPKFGTNIFIKLLEMHKPHILYAVPPINFILVLMLLNNEHIKLKHIESLRQVICSASPLGAADIEKFLDKTHGKKNFMQIYGGSGLLVPNTLAKIVDVNDSTNKPLEMFKSGELLVKGPQIMKGYHNNPQSTSSTIVDEWMRTGDIGHYDGDGQFYITDRLKELIKVKGFQVAPAELEELLRGHPAVSDAAVIGVKHINFGEIPKAFVVLKPTPRSTPADIRKFVDEKVATYKRLTGGVVSQLALAVTAIVLLQNAEIMQMTIMTAFKQV
ncbi:hypothetical protein Trydic_g2688 [Trypoxylus dichotomus]